ncbi:hypothetical protein HIM_08536 [Hirsutella minnesotensis 3608]|uniref:Peptidase A1 domain-containing protein n=1 Tax=Hirsutella minnesotensis 3608 TaxID=1043627 RepID=A0A0F7ZH61_9HYPO|nr:hypothetical protein HIM_08536 [Hirsutella minnesotensis 3608]
MAPLTPLFVFLTLALSASSSPHSSHGAHSRRHSTIHASRRSLGVSPRAVLSPESSGSPMQAPPLIEMTLRKKAIPHLEPSVMTGTLPVAFLPGQDDIKSQATQGKGGSNSRTVAKQKEATNELKNSNGTKSVHTQSEPSPSAFIKSTPGSSGIISLPVIHAPPPSQLRKRQNDGTNQAMLTTRSDVAYYIELAIGTPPQPVRVQIDTGSFELWVNADCTSLKSRADVSFCNQNRRYEARNSRTARPVGEDKTLRYGIGAANITYVSDNISLPGSDDVMNQVRFGMAKSSQDQFSGILGIGFGRDITVSYNNFIDELAVQGITRTKTFGVALGAKDENGGAITFGGVDTSKFAGRLAALPIIPAAQSPDKVARYWINMRSIAHTGPDRNSVGIPGTTMPVFLDTGATLTLLPSAVVRAMAAALGARTDPGSMLQGSFYQVSCGLADLNGSFDFSFDGVTIYVPYREIIRQLPQQGQQPACYLGVMQSDKFSLLGDTFLRSAYVVFDLDNNMTYLARQTNCGSSPQPINPNTNLRGMRGRCPEPSVAQNRPADADSFSNSSNRPNLGAAPGLALDKALLALAVGIATSITTLSLF